MIFSKEGGKEKRGDRKAKTVLLWFFALVFFAGASYFVLNSSAVSFPSVFSRLKEWMVENNFISQNKEKENIGKIGKKEAPNALSEKPVPNPAKGDSNAAKPAPEQIQAEDQARVIAESENYKIKSLAFGGDTVSLADSEKTLPLEIYDIKSESFIEKNNNEAKIVVSWKTNKLAISQVEYSRNGGKNPKVVREAGYGFNHSAVLSGLEQATAYVYSVKCRDRWGNEAVSGLYGAYTGSKIISVFELIGKAAGDIFGWTMKFH